MFKPAFASPLAPKDVMYIQISGKILLVRRSTILQSQLQLLGGLREHARTAWAFRRLAAWRELAVGFQEIRDIAHIHLDPKGLELVNTSSHCRRKPPNKVPTSPHKQKGEMARLSLNM